MWSFSNVIRIKDLELYKVENLSFREIWMYNANVRTMALGLCKWSDERIVMESLIKGFVLLTS